MLTQGFESSGRFGHSRNTVQHPGALGVITNRKFEVPDRTISWNQSGGTNGKVIVRLTILFVIVLAVMGVRSAVRRSHERARAKWKTGTLQRLAGLSITNEEIRRELNEIKARTSAKVPLGWTHEHVLLMTNEEYLIYAMRHGRNDGSLDHLFLAHASDGRWLYSTFHFCNGMVAIMSDPPPGSTAEFQNRYAVREFDGKSDECLKHTWPVK